MEQEGGGLPPVAESHKFPFPPNQQQVVLMGERNYNKINNPLRGPAGSPLEEGLASSFLEYRVDLSGVIDNGQYIKTLGEHARRAEGLLKKDPKNVEFQEYFDQMSANLIGFGQSAFTAGQYETAIKAFEEARVLNSKGVQMILK